MQLIASGKWSKTEKRWNMVVALRHQPARTPLGPRRAAQRAAVVLLHYRAEQPKS